MSLSHPRRLIFSSKSSIASSFYINIGFTKTGTPAVCKRLMPSSHPTRILFSSKSSFASSFYINIGLTKTGTPSDSIIKDLLSDGVFILCTSVTV